MCSAWLLSTLGAEGWTNSFGIHFTCLAKTVFSYTNICIHLFSWNFNLLPLKNCIATCHGPVSISLWQESVQVEVPGNAQLSKEPMEVVTLCANINSTLGVVLFTTWIRHVFSSAINLKFFLRRGRHNSYQGLIQQSVASLGTKLWSPGISRTIQTLLLVQEGKEGKAFEW